MTSAVIFDMDGLLIDSEPLWVRAEIEVFGSCGVVLTEGDCAKTKGLRIDDIVAYWLRAAPGAFGGASADTIAERLVERVVALVTEHGRALRGAEHALEMAREGGRPIALASSSPKRLIDATLARLGLADAFSVVQSAETEELGKPHPAIFLRTAERLGVPAVDCVVLEDSMTGVIAAKAARMRCIAVPFGHPDHDPRFCLADRVVASLAQLGAEDFRDFTPRE
jgi:sugar-phosphatase